MAVLFVGWTAFFFYALWRFHRTRNPKANYHGVKSKASAHLEFTVVLIEAVLLLGFGLPLWHQRVAPDEWPDKDQALRVRAVGEQFRLELSLSRAGQRLRPPGPASWSAQ